MTYWQQKLKEAEEFATAAHDRIGQRYGGLPYSAHLKMVESVRLHFGLHDMIGCACWLHDTLEDCPDVTKELIEERFSMAVAKLVWAVTDGKGSNLDERKKESYFKMRAFPASILVKMCDRIANVETSCLDSDGTLLRMYRKEHAKFCEELKLNHLNWPMIGARLRPMVEHLNRLISGDLGKMVLLTPAAGQVHPPPHH